MSPAAHLPRPLGSRSPRKAQNVAKSSNIHKSDSMETSELDHAAGDLPHTSPRVEQVRLRQGVGYVGLRVSATDLEKAQAHDSRAIVWFDIDNTLYHKSTRIAQLMGERIHAYFLGLGLPDSEAKALHTRYYKDHGLAIRGLLKHHNDIDPLDYDRRVDGSLPLDDLLHPEAELTALLYDLDRTKCRVFALTNAYKTHAMRCIRLLGIEDLFDGVLYCDYAAGPLFCCKPDPGYYEAAAEIVGVTDHTKFYFVDDNEKNIRAAKKLGWYSAIFYNEADPENEQGVLPDQRPEPQERTDAVAKINGGGLVPSNSASPLDEEAIKQQFSVLSTPQRVRLFELVLDCTLPNEIALMHKAWKRHFMYAQDVVSRMPESLHLAIFERLPLKDLLRCRLVSKNWLKISSQPALWRSHALALTESDAEPLNPPDVETGWESLVKALHLRERNWSSGLAQNIQLCYGHTGYVTSMKLRGKNILVTGSYDGSIRVWDLSHIQHPICTKEIRADKIACLDFVITGCGEGFISAGLYDIGRTLIFDLRTGNLLQTLNGHNKGIRHVAINETYVVSTGQDKAICVWDHKTGERVARFGQQTNVSLGVCLIDTDKLIAATIDGIIRSFSIRGKKLIGEFDIARLSGKRDEVGDVLKELTADGGTLSWFAAEGTSITVASKSLVVHLQWREHVVYVQSSKDSAENSYSVSPLPRAGPNSSLISCASPASTPVRRNNNSGAIAANGGKHDSGSHGARSAVRSSVPPQSPSAPRTNLAPTTCGQPGMATPSVRATPCTPIRNSHDSPMMAPSRSASSPTSLPGLARVDSISSSQESSGNSSSTAVTRLAPNLREAPLVVSVVRTPEVAVGAVDPRKRRMVCASRFSSRMGSERKLYTSTYSDDIDARASADLVQTGNVIRPDQPPHLASIGGAWQAHAQELATPERNPMVVVLDHDSVVVGCSDGLVYRIGFVGQAYVSPSPGAAEASIASDVGDATITDLTQLRGLEGWRDLFLPEGTKDDHPGRVKVDVLKKPGLR